MIQYKQKMRKIKFELFAEEKKLEEGRKKRREGGREEGRKEGRKERKKERKKE
jgi:hypothetical protein